MIWRLQHPVRGIVVFAAIFGFGSTLGGFGVGVPELAILALLAAGAGYLAAARRSGDIKA